MDDDSDSGYSPRKSSLQKQKALRWQKIVNRVIEYECQPLLTKHAIYIQKLIDQKQKIDIEPLPLTIYKKYLENILISRKLKSISRFQKTSIQKKISKRCSNLNQNQRIQTQLLQQSGYKNSVIAELLGVSTQQVRTNKIILQMTKSREEIQINEIEINWLKYQAQQESNSMLFNAIFFRRAFLNQFPNQNLSINQFRKLLHQCQIRYRTPLLKPVQFFEKDGKKEETKFFISKLCGYLIQNHKIIYIDECSLGNISKSSHKLWHIQGSFNLAQLLNLYIRFTGQQMKLMIK